MQYHFCLTSQFRAAVPTNCSHNNSWRKLIGRYFKIWLLSHLILFGTRLKWRHIHEPQMIDISCWNSFSCGWLSSHMEPEFYGYFEVTRNLERTVLLTKTRQTKIKLLFRTVLSGTSPNEHPTFRILLHVRNCSVIRRTAAVPHISTFTRTCIQWVPGLFPTGKAAAHPHPSRG